MTISLDPIATDTDASPLPSPRQALDWLSTLSPAPKPAASAPRIRDDVPANGKLQLLWQGAGFAFVMQGDRAFIDRWFAWAMNTGVIGRCAQLNWFLERHEGNVAYVCVRNREVVKRGLAMQFVWEIRRDHEVPPLSVTVIDEETGLKEVVENEGEIERLAAERAAAFMEEHLKPETTRPSNRATKWGEPLGLFATRPRDIGHVYGLVSEGRVGRSNGAEE